MTPFVTAGAGFLLAVLWFDLMFDLRAKPGAIAAYYSHVTTGARPMNRLVALVMLATLAAITAQVAGDGDWASWVSLALALSAFGIAGGRTFAAARSLARNPDQTAVVLSIRRDHLVCLGLMSALLALQLAR